MSLEHQVTENRLDAFGNPGFVDLPYGIQGMVTVGIDRVDRPREQCSVAVKPSVQSDVVRLVETCARESDTSTPPTRTEAFPLLIQLPPRNIRRRQSPPLVRAASSHGAPL